MLGTMPPELCSLDHRVAIVCSLSASLHSLSRHSEAYCQLQQAADMCTRLGQPLSGHLLARLAIAHAWMKQTQQSADYEKEALKALEAESKAGELS
jgi:hypothetical protein